MSENNDVLNIFCHNVGHGRRQITTELITASREWLYFYFAVYVYSGADW